MANPRPTPTGARHDGDVAGCRVLVTDGETRTALAVVRSLVAAGCDVHVTGASQRTLASVSRGAIGVALTTDPLRAPATYAYELGALAERVRAQLVLPVTDASVDALVRHAAALPASAVLPFPDAERVATAADKGRMLEHARAAGLDVPTTVFLHDARVDRQRIAPLLPAVLKPHRTIVTDGARHHKTGVAFVNSLAACEAALRGFPPGAFPVLLQRRVRGVGEGVFLLRWNGRTVAHFGHRRLREKPPAGGISVYRESIRIPDAVLASAERLADTLDWRGVAMIECKVDAWTGRHVFMELNGRFWGSLQLAVDAGVDFPRLLAQCVTSAPPAAIPSYREGVRSRWFFGDADHLWLRLTRRNAALHLEADAPSRSRAVLEFLRRRSGTDRDEIWRWPDVRPGLFELRQRLLGRG